MEFGLLGPLEVRVDGEPVPEQRPSEPQSPEPGDILHVPKTYLA